MDLTTIVIRVLIYCFIGTTAALASDALAQGNAGEGVQVLDERCVAERMVACEAILKSTVVVPGSISAGQCPSHLSAVQLPMPQRINGNTCAVLAIPKRRCPISFPDTIKIQGSDYCVLPLAVPMGWGAPRNSRGCAEFARMGPGAERCKVTVTLVSYFKKKMKSINDSIVNALKDATQGGSDVRKP